MRPAECPRPQRAAPALRDPLYCELRGFHGPFERTEVYDRMEEWEGMGDCLTCGSCRHVPSEAARQASCTALAPERS